MQEGALRADVNVSVAKEGNPPGVKIEIKNLNSFRAAERAVRYEVERQITALEGGLPLTQETRGWDENSEVTIGQRSKEHAEDYRYFPEPDLPPLLIDRSLLDQIGASLPELATDKRARYQTALGLSAYDAGVLTQALTITQLFDETVALTSVSSAKAAANWLTGEYLRLLSESKAEPEDAKITAETLADLISLIESGEITTPVAKSVFAETFETGESPSAIVSRKGLRQLSDRSELENTVREVLAANDSLVAEYVNKDRKTEGPLVGKVMAATKGTANPAVVKEIIADLLLKSEAAGD